jgi:cation:H+ antiporter
VNLILLFIGLALLIFGAEIIIRGSISLGKKFKVSLFAIGVVIVAGGTSLPELASSINAVITNHADLAVGAVIGSNIANLILVMAATSFLIPISNINQNQINQAWINIGLAIILIFMSYFILSFNYLFGILSICLLFIIMFIQSKAGFT